MYARTKVERQQADRICFLEAKVAILEEENMTLKAALTHQTIEAEISYRDNIERFDQLSKQILPLITRMVKIHKRAITYDEIIKAFQTQHPNVAKAETITRRVRELRADGWLGEPKRGTFIPIPKK